MATPPNDVDATLAAIPAALTPVPPATRERVLRVLRGLHRGAEASLAQDDSILVGCDDNCHVVLVDPGIAPHHLSVRNSASGVQVRALADGLQLDGTPVASGDEVAVADYCRLTIGSAVIAFGAAGAPGWFEAELALSGEVARRAGTESPDGPASELRDPPPLTGIPPGIRRDTAAGGTARHRVAVALAVGGIAVIALVSLSFASWSGSMGMPTSTDLPPADTQPALPAAPAEAKPPVVHTGEQLAEDVREVFRVNGLRVKTEAEGPGSVRVDGADGDAHRIDMAAAHALEDIPGLSVLRVPPRHPPAAPTPAPVAARAPDSDADSRSGLPQTDARKRIAEVVDGPPAYIVTADGSRYFVGAVMPQGYRIVAIDGTSVTVEKPNGRQLVQTF